MSARASESPLWQHVLRVSWRQFGRRRSRRRLAAEVRTHARAEAERRQRAGVVEYASVRARTALYEQIACRLEAVERPVSTAGIARVRLLLAEPRPLLDYGPSARDRDIRVASILRELAAAES